MIGDDDTRGVSSSLGFVLTLGIATVLVSGLLIAGGDFVDDRRTQVVRSELDIIGQQVASDIATADRLVNASDGSPTVTIDQRLPNTVTGAGYRIRLVADADPHLQLEAVELDVSTTIPLTNKTTLGDSTVTGGPITVAFDSGADELVIQNG